MSSNKDRDSLILQKHSEGAPTPKNILLPDNSLLNQDNDKSLLFYAK